MTSKVVVITGASSGIGAALAELLAARGDRVALVARRAERLAAVAARCGEGALTLVADMGERAQAERAAAAALALCGRIDVWVNNAGQGISVPPSQLTDADMEAMLRANVYTALYGMQAVLPHFKERGEGQVVNVSSMLGRVPFATLRSAYCGAKHFLNALTITMRAEVQATHPGIQFSLVSPGVVYTDFGLSARGGGPDSRSFPEGQSAAEVAAVIAGVIDARRPDVYTRAGSRQRVADYYQQIAEDP